MQLLHLEMVFVQGGTLMQGSREVTLSDFELGKYPVTQALWEAVMGEGSNPSRFEGPRRPVERVSWYDAVAFCNRLNALAQMPFCYFSDEQCTRPYALEGKLPNEGPVFYKPTAGASRLPTEAEWEYAGRGGQFHTKTEYAGTDRVEDAGWYSKNSSSETNPVGLLQPNALGLYDLSGNVFEWCWDWYGDDFPKGKPNPVGPQKGEFHVVRGGAWINDNNYYMRLSNSYHYSLNNRTSRFGFRIARHFTL